MVRIFTVDGHHSHSYIIGLNLKMASLQFNLEDRSKMDKKYRKQIQNLQAKINNADARFTRDEETLLKIKDKMHRIEEHRKKKEEEEKKKKKKK